MVGDDVACVEAQRVATDESRSFTLSRSLLDRVHVTNDLDTDRVYRFIVEPADVSAENTAVSGPGIEGGTLGVETSFFIESSDCFGNRVNAPLPGAVTVAFEKPDVLAARSSSRSTRSATAR